MSGDTSATANLPRRALLSGATLFTVGGVSTLTQIVTLVALGYADQVDYGARSTGGLLALVAAAYTWFRCRTWEQWRQQIALWVVVTVALAAGATYLITTTLEEDTATPARAHADGRPATPQNNTVHGVTITGDLGSEPNVNWDGKLNVDQTYTVVVKEGEGPEIKNGDQVQAYLWIGNGRTNKKAYSDFDAGQPETVKADDNLSPVFKDAVLGQKYGARVAVTTTAQEAFGDAGNTQLGISNTDSVLIIVDLMAPYEAATAKNVHASRMPTIVEKDGKPVSLHFTGLPKPNPNADLERHIVKEGTGKRITQNATLTVNYLGQLYDAKKPFDENYSGQPATFSLQQVIKGWTHGLTGVKVGSRVLLAIPPDLGYGDSSQPGIPANSTLYFLVDIHKAS